MERQELFSSRLAIRKTQAIFDIKEDDMFNLIALGGLMVTRILLKGFILPPSHRLYRPSDVVSDKIIPALLKGIIIANGKTPSEEEFDGMNELIVSRILEIMNYDESYIEFLMKLGARSYNISSPSPKRLDGYAVDCFLEGMVIHMNYQVTREIFNEQEKERKKKKAMKQQAMKQQEGQKKRRYETSKRQVKKNKAKTKPVAN